LDRKHSPRGYCVKYEPKKVLEEYQFYVSQHYKADHAVAMLAQKYCKSRRTIFGIIKLARESRAI
jgi:hypothetical protein